MKCPHCEYEDKTSENIIGEYGKFFENIPYSNNLFRRHGDGIDSQCAILFGCPKCKKVFIDY